MQLIAPILSFVFVFSCVATYVVKRWAQKRGLIDSPNIRSSHFVPTPRGGGIAIVLAFSAGTGLLCWAGLFDLETWFVMLGSGLAIALVGFVDDMTSVAPYLRLVVHIVAAVTAVSLIGGIQLGLLDGFGRYRLFVSFLLSVIAIVWGTNLFNFMDGIDGIAASEAVFVSVAGAFFNWELGGDIGLTAAMLCLAVASFGFLLWNWPPASLFMGDVGSGFLGFILIVFMLLASQQRGIMLTAWLILGGVFFTDATVTLMRRVLRRDHWVQPHRTHAYQHLVQRFDSHITVTLIVTAVNLFWLLPWAWIAVNVRINPMVCISIALGPLFLSAVILKAGVPAGQH
jgi:Fuc2NAc and GlcNAc transferase